MLRLQPRSSPSRALSMASPILALGITVVLGAGLFVLLGKDPLRGLSLFFVAPLDGARALSELSVKATPVVIIALGLAACFRANVWNIGAEGQFIAGALAGGGVAIHVGPGAGGGSFVLVLLASVLGGMAWSAIPAFLRDRFAANEILVTLMLVYVAELLLGYFVYGPWKDPNGFNFPQSIMFPAAARAPRLARGYRANVGVPLALALAGLFWVFLFRTGAGFAVDVFGKSPRAARYAGFSPRKALWTVMLGSGATAGLAGGLEVAGPLGQLTPYVPAGYGFAAIIAAFVGRLHPLGVIASGVLISMFYLGGELAQSRLGLPKSITFVFEGVLLFALLACDGLTHYRIIRVARSTPPLPKAPAEPSVAPAAPAGGESV